MKKVLLLFVVFLLQACFVTLQSASVLPGQAFRMAKSFLRNQPGTTFRQGVSLELTYVRLSADTSTSSSGEDVLYYIYNIGDQNGFVIVAGDDRVPPILGYAESGNFDQFALPPALLAWLEDCREQMISLKEKQATAPEEVRSLWLPSLSSVPAEDTSFEFAKTEDRLSSHEKNTQTFVKKCLYTPKWGQENPYNQFCPYYIEGRRAATGCGATALSILMKYNRWPLTGVGENAYESESLNQTIPLYERFEGVAYDWDLMPDQAANTIDGLNPWTEEEGYAVATLMYHSGVAVNMNYGVDWQGTSLSDLDNLALGLIRHFRYDQSMQFLLKNRFNDTEWENLIQTNIEAGQPIIYRGADSQPGSEGHFFVVDGYLATLSSSGKLLPGTCYHVNWGWEGVGNGYYLLTALHPESEGEDLGDYSFGHSMICGIKKAETGSRPHWELVWTSAEPLKKSPESLQPGELFEMTFAPVRNMGLFPVDFTLALVLTDSDGNLKTVLTQQDIHLEGWERFSDICVWEAVLPAGSQASDCLKFVYREIPEDGSPSGNWLDLRGLNGAVCSLPVGRETVANEMLPYSKPNIRLISDRLEVCSVNASTVQSVYLYGVGGHLIKNWILGSKEYLSYLSDNGGISFPVNDLPAGTYLVCVHTLNGLLSDWLIKK